MEKKKNYRKRSSHEEEDEHQQEKQNLNTASDDEEEERRLVLEEVKFLQKRRERKFGLPAIPTPPGGGGGGGGGGGAGGTVKTNGDADKNEAGGGGGGGGGDGEKDDLVLQDTFAQETAVLVEDPNMVKYIEQELAKKRGRTLDETDQVENELKRAEDELFQIPDHLKVKRRFGEESSTQWTTGIAEVQLPIDYKLKNIEETEAAKKLLQEKRLMTRPKSEFGIPSSYSADYFQRGRDYAEKLRREHPELYKRSHDNVDATALKPNDSGNDAAGRRLAATDEIMLDRFRKRERQRVMRR